MELSKKDQQRIIKLRYSVPTPTARQIASYLHLEPLDVIKVLEKNEEQKVFD